MNHHYPRPPFPDQQQPEPGLTKRMEPTPDHGESSYAGTGRLVGRKALITGGDSGIGRAIAIAYAREGADVAIAYLDEHEDAAETLKWIEEAGRKGMVFLPAISLRRACAATLWTRWYRHWAGSTFS